jgi:hypothetical protein
VNVRDMVHDYQSGAKRASQSREEWSSEKM